MRRRPARMSVLRLASPVPLPLDVITLAAREGLAAADARPETTPLGAGDQCRARVRAEPLSGYYELGVDIDRRHRLPTAFSELACAIPAPGVMQTVGVRDLVNRASALLDELEQGGQPIIVTRRGQPIAVLSAIDAEEFCDYVLAHAPEFVRGARKPMTRSLVVSSAFRWPTC